MRRSPAFDPFRPRSGVRRAVPALTAVVGLLAVALAPAAWSEAGPTAPATTETTADTTVITAPATDTTAPATSATTVAATSATTAPATTATTAKTTATTAKGSGSTTACPAPAAAPATGTNAPVAAVTIPSATPLPSWGTAKASTGKAGRVNAVVSVGDTVYLGGAFTKMVAPGGGSATARDHLAAVDARTGKLTAWNPHVDGTIWSLALSADQKSVYVGGDFHHIGGRSVSKLAKVDLATGKADPSFHPAVNGRVRAITLAGTRLYIGGEFTTVAKQSRPKLAAIDPATGALQAWTPPALGRGRYLTHVGTPTPDYDPGHVFAIAVIGGKVFAAGTFTNFACQGGLVTLDAATGGLVSPQYKPGRPVFDLTTANGVLYAVGGGPGGRAWAYSPDKAKPLWTVKFDGDAVGVATSGSVVYVAGHYDYVVSKDSSCYQYCPGGPTRHHLTAVNAATGTLVNWNPAFDTSTGPETAWVGAHAVFVGGEFNKVDGKAQPGLAIFPTAANPPVAPAAKKKR
ncbi:MAG TPA: hypothetical protein VHL53_10915 [Acidimicrobiia bacterium]|nr:hypothetical protein [Acidimicrobiia bacterium]